MSMVAGLPDKISNMDTQHALAGVGVMVVNERGEVLLGLRHSSHGAGEWSFPGGKVDLGETIEETAKRETKEETNLEIDDLELVSLTDELRYLKDGKQFVVIGFKANHYQGELKLANPERFHEWRWFSLDNLPQSLFEGTELMIRNYLAGKIYQG